MVMLMVWFAGLVINRSVTVLTASYHTFGKQSTVKSFAYKCLCNQAV